ncbi:MAG: prolyl aminopeptidase [Pseudomonadota bacterium]
MKQGYLAVSGGHQLYWEAIGPEAGIPALYLHGGPGSGCSPKHRDLFDDRFLAVLFDQRGSGRSTPHAGDTAKALSDNTTAHLIDDIEALRTHLGIDAWVVVGGSWGTSLGLLYAQAHPERVRALVLGGVATSDPLDLRWLYGDVGNLFPEAYADFAAQVPDAADPFERMAAYADQLSQDGEIAQAAADAWCRWETALFEETITDPVSRWSDPRFRLCFARIVTHYFSHAAWIEPGQILRDMHRIAAIPGIMVHSRFDPSAPVRAPWELAQVWPRSELRILDGSAHSTTHKQMGDAMRKALSDIN